MQAHIVLAHPEPTSFNAHLADIARRELEKRNWTVTVSDLYAMGFDPCERPEHYLDRLEPDRFDVQAEQRHASDQGSIPAEVRSEIKHLDQADLDFGATFYLCGPPPMQEDVSTLLKARGVADAAARDAQDGD